MSEDQLRVKTLDIKKEFQKEMDRIILDAWKRVFGWRRFFIADWWRLKFGVTPRMP